MYMLQVDSVDMYYGDLQALFGVSLYIKEKEIISIVGSNGAGKTTMINVISGMLCCSSGKIEFLGKRIDRLPPHKIVEEGIVQIPEGRQLFPKMNVIENLEMGAYTRQARRKIEENLEMVLGLFPILKERKDQLAGSLSGGEQQMLAIGRALMARPKLLMLDEPSLGLAPMMVRQVFVTVKSINEFGTTILLVEQNVFNSLSISDRGYVLENGRIVMEGEGKEILENEKIKEAYLGI
jgi:branched-chain amino acid transport system ATP-binding protein